MALLTKLVSSLEKCFYDENIDAKPALKNASMLKNERFSFQFLYVDKEAQGHSFEKIRVVIDSPLAECIHVRSVEHVANMMPVYPGMYDEDYLRIEPGLYPDPLLPLRDEAVQFIPTLLQSVWIDVDPRGKAQAGQYAVTVKLVQGDSVLASETLNLIIVNAELPPQETIVTQWFHTDCLANYYKVPVFSERHWEIVRNFMKMAAEHGQNVIYLPLFTPPLDTAVGGERTTVQLVDITEDATGYHFNFDKADRWCEMALELGFAYFEVVHLFTQWGAGHAPKIMVNCNGNLIRKFGWETDSLGEEYRTFLRAFLKAFIAHMKERGWDHRCRYHISDEPNPSHLATYQAAKNSISDLLADYPITDALSDFQFYQKGVVERPTSANDHIQPFLDAGVKELGVYYCCGQWNKVSNRFLSMPGARTRIIGVQMYRNGVDSFLQWGYNFYNNRFSTHEINPWQTNTGDYFAQAGDAFIVYPNADGTPIASMRLLQFADAFQDIRALKLCEQLCGKEFVEKLIDRCGEVRFDEYPRGSAYILELREAINAAIAAAIA